MIGQKELLERIDNLIEENKWPRFVIISGSRGSEKDMLISHIVKKLGCITIGANTSVSDVRQAVTQIQMTKGDTVMCTFCNADTMSLAAKNALLKIVEEPPKNAYFIMTLESLQNTLDTIKSRATIFNMQPYSLTDIYEYMTLKYDLTSEEQNIVADICETPGDVDILYEDGISAFDKYVNTVVDYIAEVSGANSFSIAKRIKFKDDDEGFDLLLFFRAFISKCAIRMAEDVIRYAQAIRITTKRMQELNVNGINKQNVFDMWILDIRQAWMD